jgi:hypothetical protein
VAEKPVDSITSQAAEPSNIRRVGTFTFGAALVACGTCMLVSMFFPQLDFTLALKLSPLMLVSLGGETLLAARGGGRIKYDWVGMLLCCLIVGAALVLYILAWGIVHTDALRLYH